MRNVRLRVDGRTRSGAPDGAAVIEPAGAPWALLRRRPRARAEGFDPVGPLARVPDVVGVLANAGVRA